uniref:THAP-type domain-containing protein n=1 Tax=Oncorhynchus mykiss TaxID=8022 RepID=A0A8C7V0P9_ONCMY
LPSWLWCMCNYKQVQASGVTFHQLPAGDIPRSRQWLAAIKNAAYNVNPPVENSVFKASTFSLKLKSEAIPFISPITSKRKASNQPTSAQQKTSRAEVTYLN